MTINDTSASSTTILRHVVLFEFAAEYTEAQIDEVVQRFAQLPTLVPDIEAFEWGVELQS